MKKIFFSLLSVLSILFISFLPGKVQAQVVDSTKAADTDVFTVVEEMPQFPEGEKAMYDYISKNVQYPQLAIETGVQGKVYVGFTVDTDGTITDVKVIRGIGGGCDQEAVRVIKKMPKWTPGKKSGRPVRVKYTIPISFVLN